MGMIDWFVVAATVTGIVMFAAAAVYDIGFAKSSEVPRGPDFEQAEIDAYNAHKLELAKQAALEHELGIWPHEEPEQAPVQEYTLGGPIKIHKLKECQACAAVKRGGLCLCDRCNPWVAKYGS